MDTFHEVHVVSDLHLGGESGHQIFKGAALLGAFLDSLTKAPSDRRIAFVINGDFVDFLAEPNARYFDPLGAPDRLQRIREDSSFSAVWDALRGFVAASNRQLVIVLGNHDIELALPATERRLLDLLCDNNDAARGRVRLSTTGAGFAATVAGARVVCVHGNEVDSFNVNDYETLRRAARHQQFGASIDPWVPNAGTKLVIDIMNGIKRSLPFVDLLKPETDAVVPLLVALDQVNIERCLEAIEVASRLSWDALRQTFGLLSEEATGAQASACAQPKNATAAQEKLVTLLHQAFEIPSVRNDQVVAKLLADAEERFRSGVTPEALVLSESEGQLGLWNLAKAAIQSCLSAILGRSESETMRAALAHLRADTSFDRSAEDEVFEKLDEALPDDIDVLVAGHTHLERVCRRSKGGMYINTGTWARLIKIDERVLNDPDLFAQRYNDLRSRTMQELDDSGLVVHQPAVASIEECGGFAAAGLWWIGADGKRTKPAEVKQ